MTALILAGLDPEVRDLAPVRCAVEIARFTGALVVIVDVRGATGNGAAHAAELEPELRRAVPALADVSATLRSVTARSAADGLHAAVAEEGADLVVVGSGRHRGGAAALVLGSTPERLIHEASWPVAVVPAGVDPRRVAVVGAGFDASEGGRRALRAAAVLARAARARLRVFSVLRDEPGAVPEPADADPRGVRPDIDDEDRAARHRRHVEASVAETLASVPARGDVVPEIFYGHPADALVPVTAHVDLLVVGASEQSPRVAALRGEVVHRLTLTAHCPLIVVPRAGDRPLERLLTSATAEERDHGGGAQPAARIRGSAPPPPRW